MTDYVTAEIPYGQKYAMISLPMRSKPLYEIVEDFNRHKRYLEHLGYEVINTIFTPDADRSFVCDGNGTDRTPVKMLGESIIKMAIADVIYFAKGWETARGCVIEHEVAKRYSIPCMYE